MKSLGTDDRIHQRSLEVAECMVQVASIMPGLLSAAYRHYYGHGGTTTYVLCTGIAVILIYVPGISYEYSMYVCICNVVELARRM